ncbi:MAG: SDR family oxidoreductase [Ectothiorhodospiraceae bacterium]|nr:SDR family oxidoreductase [Chromatiales bacterium]MCP5153598.1 SDR family oxidoreductase [Ectothiorhodospiraceae bacterium]
MSSDRDAQVICVTGAGTGIGRAISHALARSGARVAVADLDPTAAETVAAEIEAAGRQATAFEIDVTDRASVARCLSEVVGRHGRIDAWCNNAGVSTMAPFLDLTDEDWEHNMGVNARGTFVCSQAAVRQMLAQPRPPGDGPRGRIVNIASMAGKRGNAPFLAHYVASKFAVVGLTQAMAGELASARITVNAVCPGYVRTGMQAREVQWEARLRGVDAERVVDDYVRDTPLGRLQTPEDVAGVVAFLCSPAADFLTGEAINVNGGAFMD